MDGRRYPSRPIVGVGVVVLDADRVLLIKRGRPPRAGSWSLPGGAQECGETLKEAALREIYEETNLNIEILGLIDTVDSIRRDKNGDPEYHYTLIDFAARVTGGILRAGDDAVDSHWFTIKEINNLDIWSETRRIIRMATKQYNAKGKSITR